MGNELFILRPREVAAAVRKAQAEGRLGYQREGITSCEYRYHCGAVCAIGAGIPDDVFNPDWEGDGLTSLLDLEPAGLAVESDAARDVLQNLQVAHDSLCDEERRADPTCLEDFETALKTCEEF